MQTENKTVLYNYHYIVISHYLDEQTMKTFKDVNEKCNNIKDVYTRTDSPIVLPIDELMIKKHFSSIFNRRYYFGTRRLNKCKIALMNEYNNLNCFKIDIENTIHVKNSDNIKFGKNLVISNYSIHYVFSNVIDSILENLKITFFDNIVVLSMRIVVESNIKIVDEIKNELDKLYDERDIKNIRTVVNMYYKSVEYIKTFTIFGDNYRINVNHKDVCLHNVNSLKSFMKALKHYPLTGNNWNFNVVVDNHFEDIDETVHIHIRDIKSFTLKNVNTIHYNSIIFRDLINHNKPTVIVSNVNNIMYHGLIVENTCDMHFDNIRNFVPHAILIKCMYDVDIDDVLIDSNFVDRSIIEENGVANRFPLIENRYFKKYVIGGNYKKEIKELLSKYYSSQDEVNDRTMYEITTLSKLINVILSTNCQQIQRSDEKRRTYDTIKTHFENEKDISKSFGLLFKFKFSKLIDERIEIVVDECILYVINVDNKNHDIIDVCETNHYDELNRKLFINKQFIERFNAQLRFTNIRMCNKDLKPLDVNDFNTCEEYLILVY